MYFRTLIVKQQAILISSPFLWVEFKVKENSDGK